MSSDPALREQLEHAMAALGSQAENLFREMGARLDAEDAAKWLAVYDNKGK